MPEILLLKKENIQKVLNGVDTILYNILSRDGKVKFQDCNPIAQATWMSYERGFKEKAELDKDKKYTQSDLEACMRLFLNHKQSEIVDMLVVSAGSLKDKDVASEVVKLYLKSIEKTEWEVEVDFEQTCIAESGEPCLCKEKFGYIRTSCQKLKLDSKGYINILSAK